MARLFKGIVNIIFVLLIIVLLAYVYLNFKGMVEIYSVKTGSMEDNIHVGDYILIYKKKNYRIGDVVTYQKNNYFITHRIIEKNGNKIVTKGDANNTIDEEIDVKEIVGKVILSGGILNAIINYKYVLAAGFVALYLLSCYFGENEEKIEISEDVNASEKNDVDISPEIEDNNETTEEIETEKAEIKGDIEKVLSESEEKKVINEEANKKDDLKDEVEEISPVIKEDEIEVKDEVEEVITIEEENKEELKDEELSPEIKDNIEKIEEILPKSKKNKGNSKKKREKNDDTIEINVETKK